MKCPWCGSEKIKHDFAQTTTAPYVLVELGGAKLPMAAVSMFSECECGLVFQEHTQSPEWYDWFYSSGTYRKTLGITQEEMDVDEKNRAYEITNWLRERDIKFQYHFDIGSSRGYFLNNTKWVFGCQIGGDELNTSYSQLTNAPDKRVPDMVSAIHVLEHVVDPLQKLKEWSEKTSKYFLVEVPGVETCGGALRFAHLFYFQPELLKDKLIALGFEIIAMETKPNTRILARKRKSI